MNRRFGMLFVAAAFIWPGAVVAQDAEEDPPMLMISQWKCDYGSMDAIEEDWNGAGVAAAQAAIEAGHWASAGVYYHTWADEWNVNFWAVGENEAHLIEGQEASNAAYDEALGDDGLNLWKHCSAHKDGFYQFAESVEPADESAPPGPAAAISSWKCQDVGAVVDNWEGEGRDAAQAVVDAGLWSGAGLFVHSWAGEWNVNFYYMAEDIPGILAGWETFIDSMEDSEFDLTSVCTDHRDGFYRFGDTAMGADS